MGLNLRQFLVFCCEQLDLHYNHIMEAKKQGNKSLERYHIARLLSYKEVIDQAEERGLIPKEKRKRNEQSRSK